MLSATHRNLNSSNNVLERTATKALVSFGRRRVFPTGTICRHLRGGYLITHVGQMTIRKGELPEAGCCARFWA